MLNYSPFKLGFLTCDESLLSVFYIGNIPASTIEKLAGLVQDARKLRGGGGGGGGWGQERSKDSGT